MPSSKPEKDWAEKQKQQRQRDAAAAAKSKTLQKRQQQQSHAAQQANSSLMAQEPSPCKPDVLLEIEEWKVLVPARVRSEGSPTSVVLNKKGPGSIVQGRRMGDWVQLVDEPGFMCMCSGDTFILQHVEPSRESLRIPEIHWDCPNLDTEPCLDNIKNAVLRWFEADFGDRSDLIDRLNACERLGLHQVVVDYKRHVCKLAWLLNVPESNLPSSITNLQDFKVALLEWLESDAPGASHLLQRLNACQQLGLNTHLRWRLQVPRFFKLLSLPSLDSATEIDHTEQIDEAVLAWIESGAFDPTFRFRCLVACETLGLQDDPRYKLQGQRLTRDLDIPDSCFHGIDSIDSSSIQQALQTALNSVDCSTTSDIKTLVTLLKACDHLEQVCHFSNDAVLKNLADRLSLPQNSSLNALKESAISSLQEPSPDASVIVTKLQTCEHLGLHGHPKYNNHVGMLVKLLQIPREFLPPSSRYCLEDIAHAAVQWFVVQDAELTTWILKSHALHAFGVLSDQCDLRVGKLHDLLEIPHKYYDGDEIDTWRALTQAMTRWSGDCTMRSDPRGFFGMLEKHKICVDLGLRNQSQHADLMQKLMKLVGLPTYWRNISNLDSLSRAALVHLQQCPPGNIVELAKRLHQCKQLGLHEGNIYNDHHDKLMKMVAPLLKYAPEHWMMSTEDIDFNNSVEELMKKRALDLMPGVVEAFQDLFDRSFKRICTKDRRGCPLPRRLLVDRVEKIQNMAVWAEYAQHFAKVAAEINTCGDQRPRTALLTCDQEIPVPVTSTWAEDVKNGKFQTDPEFLDCISSLRSDLSEHFLFHGTKPESAEAIVTGNFRLNLAGSNAGTLYGRGIYLAECVSKSDEYAGTDATGTILVCRATLGRVHYTSEPWPDRRQLEQLCGLGLEAARFESVCGDRELCHNTYREFIFYNTNLVYPEFLVRYRREY